MAERVPMGTGDMPEELARQWHGEVAHAATTTAALQRAARLVDALCRANEPLLGVEVADAALARVTGPDAALTLRAARASALLDAGLQTAAPADVVGALLDRADDMYASARAGSDVPAARASARWLALALGLQLHRALHTGATLSGLAADPAGFMRQFRSSAVYSALSTAAAARPRGRRLRRTWPTAGSAAILTTRSSFVAPVREAAMRAGMSVTELSLADVAPEWSGLSAVLAQRVVDLLPGVPPSELPVSSEAACALTCDLLFVDWADDAAAWASVHVPRHGRSPHAAPRLIVRLHSVEALSIAVHVIDWSRVDGVIFVSPALRALAHAIVPALASVPSAVLPHGVHVASDPPPKGEPAVIAMVGWGQAVKDPLFALEVLAETRRRDPARAWRLRLIGTPLNDDRRWDAEYAAEVNRMLASPELAGAVDIVGYSDDVDRQLESAGWLLSTSLREADPHGVLEGVASGAVPVVRRWPLIEPWGGARGLLPDEWMVSSVEEAADRILSTTPDVQGREAARWLRANRAEETARASLASALSSHGGFTGTSG